MPPFIILQEVDQLLAFLRFHVGIHGLHIIKFFQTLHHFVYRFTFFGSDIFQIVWHVSELGANNLKTIFLQISLNLSKTFGIAINRYGIFFLVFVKFILNSEIYQLQNEVVHVQVIFLSEREHAFVIKKE